MAEQQHSKNILHPVFVFQHHVAACGMLVGEIHSALEHSLSATPVCPFVAA